MEIQKKEIQLYEKKTNIIIENAENLMIKTKPDMDSAVNQLIEIKTIAKNIKSVKEKYTKPAQDIIKMARAMFNPIEQKYIEAERIIKSKMLDFEEKEQIKALKKIEKISQKVEEGEMDIVKAGEKMEELEVKKNYNGDSGSAQFKTVSEIVITSLAKIPRAYLLPNSALIRKDILAGLKIPGIELRSKKIVAGRI